MLLQNVRESLVDRTLHDKIEMKEIFEIAVNLDDIGMIEITLNLYLSAKLFNHILISEVLLG